MLDAWGILAKAIDCALYWIVAWLESPSMAFLPWLAIGIDRVALVLTITIVSLAFNLVEAVKESFNLWAVLLEAAIFQLPDGRLLNVLLPAELLAWIT